MAGTGMVPPHQHWHPISSGNKHGVVGTYGLSCDSALAQLSLGDSSLPLSTTSGRS